MIDTYTSLGPMKENRLKKSLSPYSCRNHTNCILTTKRHSMNSLAYYIYHEQSFLGHSTIPSGNYSIKGKISDWAICYPSYGSRASVEGKKELKL